MTARTAGQARVMGLVVGHVASGINALTASTLTLFTGGRVAVWLTIVRLLAQWLYTIDADATRRVFALLADHNHQSPPAGAWIDDMDAATDELLQAQACLDFARARVPRAALNTRSI